MNFFDKLTTACQRNQSLLCVGLDPTPEQLPAHHRQVNGDLVAGLLAWNRAVIEQTADLVCAYKPNIAFYEALGAPGMELLRQTLAAIPPEIPILLDAKRGDIGSTATAYADACFGQLGADAVTLSPYLGRDSIEPFARYVDKGLFVLCHTSNPSASDFQHLEINDWRTLDREPNQPLYIHVARTAVQWSPNVALVVGATYPAAIAAVRAVAPDTWLLVPGVGTQGGDLAATVQAGLRADGLGLIINASRGICLAQDYRAAAQQLRDAINHARVAEDRREKTEGKGQNTEDSLQSRVSSLQSPVSSLESPVSSLQSIFSGLADLGAIKFGNFTLASGKQSPIYIDLRLLVSKPSLLAQAAEAYAAILAGLTYDRIAGVPYAALPIATAVALGVDKPMIYLRKEVKSHGLGKEIEGAWQPGERVVVIEDLITSGGSTLQSVERLRAAGLIVEHAIVLIDRQQGGVANLAAAGVTAHSVASLDVMLTLLVQAGHLDEATRRTIFGWMMPAGVT